VGPPDSPNRVMGWLVRCQGLQRARRAACVLPTGLSRCVANHSACCLHGCSVFANRGSYDICYNGRYPVHWTTSSSPTDRLSSFRNRLIRASHENADSIAIRPGRVVFPAVTTTLPSDADRERHIASTGAPILRAAITPAWPDRDCGGHRTSVKPALPVRGMDWPCAGGAGTS